MNIAKQQFSLGLSSIGTMVSDLGNQLNGLGGALAGISLPAGLMLGQGLAAAMDFDALMNQVRVFGQLSTDELKRVEAEMLRMGAETKFSSSDAAAAMLDLMKSGMDTEAALASLPAVLNLAAAGEMSLAQAAGITTSALAMYQLPASEAARVSDALARAANASRADVSDLGQALGNVGPIANQFGLSVEETAAILAVFAQNGISGAEAGTQLKSMLMHLSSDTPATTAAWKQLGVSLYDAQGNMRDMNTVIKELDAALDKLPVEEQNRLMADLGGSYGIMGLTALRASEGIDSMLTAMEEAPAAVTIAEEFMKSFKGTLESLMGSVETLQVVALTPFMNNTLKPLAIQVTNVVNAVTAWMQANPALAEQIVQVVALIAISTPVLFGLGKVLTAVGALITFFTTGILGPLLLVLALMYAAWSTNFLGVRDIVIPVITDLIGWVTALAASIREFVADVQQVGILDAIRNAFGGQAFTIVNNFVVWVMRAFTSVRNLAREVGIFLSNAIGRVDFSGIDFSQLISLGQTLMSLTSPLGQVMTLLKLLGANINLGEAFIQTTNGITAFFSALNDGQSVFDAFFFGFGEFIDNILVALGVPQEIADQAAPALFDFAQQAQGFLGETVSFVQTTVIPGLQSLVTWFTTDGLPMMLNVISTTFMPVIQTFMGVLANIWNFVSPGLMFLADWFMNAGFGAIVNLLTGPVAAAFQTIISTMLGLWEAVSPGLLMLADWFINTGMPFVLNYISTYVLPGIGALIDLVVSIWNMVAPGLTSFANWFTTDVLPLVIDFVTNTVMPKITEFANLVAGIWTVASVGLTKFGDWFTKDGMPWIQKAIEDVQRIWGDVQKQFSDFWAQVEPKLKPIYDWFQNTFAKIGEFIKPVTDQIAGLIANAQLAYENLVKIGQWVTGQPTTGTGGGEMLPKRDSGGPGMAGMPYLIGKPQYGNELFVPQNNGSFVPDFAKILEMIANGGAGGGSPTIHFNYSGGAPATETEASDSAYMVVNALNAMGLT